MAGAARSRSPTLDGSAGDAETEAELALVARAKRDRDPEAFALLYRRYVTPVYRYCAYRLGDREAAEDATSLVFTKAFATLASHQDDRSFRSWLFAIAHNAVADSYRSRRPQQPLEAAGEVADPAPMPEELAVAAEGGRAVQALLAQLAPDQRRVLELRLAGLTGPEVAEVLGRSLGSVKIAQVRAYARLRRLLGVPRQQAKEDDDGAR